MMCDIIYKVCLTALQGYILTGLHCVKYMNLQILTIKKLLHSIYPNSDKSDFVLYMHRGS